jgi:hypothetical protein
LIALVREACRSRRVSGAELPTDSAAFIRHEFAGDGLGWFSALFGAELTFVRGRQ